MGRRAVALVVAAIPVQQVVPPFVPEAGKVADLVLTIACGLQLSHGVQVKICGGIGIIEDGELCWPLPGHTYISCNFGDDDAYGNSGHRGTDIPAPEGTPILAAHSGTVIISGWNNSYGNQVLLDNGAGLSTRYAHMTQTAVTAGEAVTAGQVIGYVGNTGDSTGNHLHFEVMQNGVRVNPMDMVSVR